MTTRTLGFWGQIIETTHTPSAAQSKLEYTWIASGHFSFKLTISLSLSVFLSLSLSLTVRACVQVCVHVSFSLHLLLSTQSSSFLSHLFVGIALMGCRFFTSGVSSRFERSEFLCFTIIDNKTNYKSLLSSISLVLSIFYHFIMDSNPARADVLTCEWAKMFKTPVKLLKIYLGCKANSVL